jgi:hypothetical protein
MCQRGKGGATDGWESTETIGCARGGEEVQQRAGSQLRPLDVPEGERRRNRGLKSTETIGCARGREEAQQRAESQLRQLDVPVPLEHPARIWCQPRLNQFKDPGFQNLGVCTQQKKSGEHSFGKEILEIDHENSLPTIIFLENGTSL